MLSCSHASCLVRCTAPRHESGCIWVQRGSAWLAMHACTEPGAPAWAGDGSLLLRKQIFSWC